MRRVAVAIALGLAGCPSSQAPVQGVDVDASPPAPAPGLGATFGDDAITFRLAAPRATRVELSIYAAPMGAAPVAQAVLERDGEGVWSTTLAIADLRAAGVDTVYYGYRVWGASWTWDPSWTPGSDAGFVARVTADGDRMNPNKLLIDPYAKELSHDPVDATAARTDDAHRDLDSGPSAPKSIALPDDLGDPGPRPTRAFADDVVYEVHLRGLTAGAGGACAGTYAAAAASAGALADLGVTAVEFLPVQETLNDQNDRVADSDAGDNYWGYSTLAYFAPDRRYACDRSPGGPTREFRDMVRAFHDRGVKVMIDVVYNHTAEGGGGSLLSWRGIDDATYYELDAAGTGFADQTGIGASTNATSDVFRAMVLDSLRWWHDRLGVDGFRFDLAPVLGNTCARGCYHYDGGGLLAQIAAAFPGAPLVAEPWGIGAGTYQLGHFPDGWSEWNDRFRESMRQSVNQVGVVDVTLRTLSSRLSGSPDIFGARGPAASVDYVVSHDGFDLHDLVACDQKSNEQPWPDGPSSGGDDNNVSWDYGGAVARQHQAARTFLALEVLGAGVPMIVGGDEVLHGQRCNNNPYNLDSPTTWLDPADATANGSFRAFTRSLLHFHADHPGLRGGGGHLIGTDGLALPDRFLDDPGAKFLGWRIGDVYVAYDGAATALTITLPPGTWRRVADTRDDAFVDEPAGPTYAMAARSLAIFVAR